MSSAQSRQMASGSPPGRVGPRVLAQQQDRAPGPAMPDPQFGLAGVDALQRESLEHGP